MKKLVFVLVLLLSISSNFAQNKSKALLDEVSQKMNSYKTIYVEFKNTLVNLEEQIKQETKGVASLKGEKYSVNFLGTTTIFDGQKKYLILPEDEEVNITNPDDDDEITPDKVFSFYKEGYTYVWDIVQNIQGRKIQFVKLIPIASDSEMKYVLLGIDNKTKNIYKMIQVGKNGTNITITISKFKTNIPISDKLFEFNRSKYETEGYLINDL